MKDDLSASRAVGLPGAGTLTNHRATVEDDPALPWRLWSLVARQGPFQGRSACQRGTAVDAAPADVVICIPAQNEARLLPACLTAIEAAAACAGRRSLVVLAINNTSDRSFAIACGRLSLPRVVVDLSFDPGISDAGHARRAAMELGRLLCRPQGYLLSTDADSIVDPGWVVRACAALDRGADMVCGALEVDQAAIDALPVSVRRAGRAEAALEAALARLWHAVMGAEAEGFANRAAGANLAVRRTTYDSVGGLPPLRTGEDRALRTLFRRRDAVIVDEPGMRVLTSCRLHGRAAGGLAACLIARACTEDPLVDDELMPAGMLLARARLRRRILDARIAGASRGSTVGELWERAVREAGLHPPRLRASEAEREAVVAAGLLSELSGCARSEPRVA